MCDVGVVSMPARMGGFLKRYLGAGESLIGYDGAGARNDDAGARIFGLGGGR